MEFNPHNNVIKLCIQGMGMEDKGERDEASKSFLQAWDAATDDFEKFTAAYYVARTRANATDKLIWLERSLQFAQAINDVTVSAAFPSLYSRIAECYEELGDVGNAKKNCQLANSFTNDPADDGPFYHGTRANLQVGDLLIPGGISNYKADLVMNHIYFTGIANGAGLAAALASGESDERVYIVEPTGSFEHDPNVTNKKFPGNPTRSYRSDSPLKVVGEFTDWVRQTPEQIKVWREKLAKSDGKIIN